MASTPETLWVLSITTPQHCDFYGNCFLSIFTSIRSLLSSLLYLGFGNLPSPLFAPHFISHWLFTGISSETAHPATMINSDLLVIIFNKYPVVHILLNLFVESDYDGDFLFLKTVGLFITLCWILSLSMIDLSQICYRFIFLCPPYMLRFVMILLLPSILICC